MKVICMTCDWKGNDADLLVAKNPFDPDETIYGCPNCNSIDSYEGVCDEPDCWNLVVMGTPTPEGYRNTCSKHDPSNVAR